MNSDKHKQFRVAPFISLYSFAHLAVDAACAFLLLRVLDLNEHLILAILIYNAAAFALQAPFGFIVDKVLSPKLAAIIGLVLVAVSFLFWNNIFAALVITGIGNALFHVGGGSLVLSMKNKKATYSGIYVAPGGIGLMLGTFLALSQGHVDLMLFPLLLIALAFILYFVETPAFNRTQEVESVPNYRVLIIALLMGVVVVRSMTGLSAEFSWQENQSLFITLIFAIELGKVFGGILVDKYGYMKVGVGALLVSAPLLSFFAPIPALAIVGAFIFNFTMPVTLVAIWGVISKYKGLAFGLPAAALFIGALPAILGKDLWIKNDWVVFLLVFSASIVLFTALYLKLKLKR